MPLGNVNAYHSESLVSWTVQMCCHNNATCRLVRLMHITIKASEPTTWYRVFFKQLTVTLVIRKTQSFTALKVHLCVQNTVPLYPVLKQFIPLHPLHNLSLRFTLILPSYLYLGLPCAPFPWGFLTDILYIFLISSCMLCPAYLTTSIL
jgi:hypothetical protein